MQIEIRRGTVPHMVAWLKNARESGVRDEKRLREILAMEDYQVEFARYGDPNLPTCGISPEEAIDFFLHFDEKDFANPRLDYKKAYFRTFYENLDARLEQLSMLEDITDGDMALVQTLLENALPEGVFRSLDRVTVLLTVSIGNSMGWPYKQYIHFDVANLEVLCDKAAFLHVLAHEIHHILFPRLMPEKMTPQQCFYLNFAFEGLAMHFCNNAATVGKPAKYPGPSFCVDGATWKFYEEQHGELIDKVLAEGQKARGMTVEEVERMVEPYEKFTFTSLKTGKTAPALHYPTYYIGCYLWGTLDLAFGKERLFAAMKSENGFEELWAEWQASGGKPPRGTR